MSANAELLWMLAEHLVLTALPGVLAALLALRHGLRSVPLLLSIALAASGLVAMAIFWATYASPSLGKAAAIAVVPACLLTIARLWRQGLDRDVLRELAVPLALWALGSAFVVYLGFLHGGLEQPLATATTRFSHPLPTDNEIPRFFADWFYAHGHGGTPPLFGDWLSSDRPPLQIGYALAQRPFGWDGSGLHYEILGVVVQQLWVVGMWALLCAARIRPLARGLAILAAMVSDVAILHGFFVWPKLIAAAFLLAALSMVLSADWTRLRSSLYAAALFALLCALAVLAHGSSVFFVVPLLVLGVLRGLPGWRWLGIAALVGLALLAPWSAYQRLADPPGDRLLKWQLGGSLEIDERGALETIVDGYRGAGIAGTLDNKWTNVTEIAGTDVVGPATREAAADVSAGHLGHAAIALRSPRFFALLPFLGILLVAPIAMAIARARGRPGGPEWRFALTAFAFCGFACVVWALLMFGGPDSTATIHVGSLAVPLLAVCACVVGAYAVHPRLAMVLVIANAALVLALYVPSFTPLAGTSYSAIAGLLATASLAGFGLVAFRRGPS